MAAVVTTPTFTDTATSVVAATTIAHGANASGTIDLRSKFGAWLFMRVGRLGGTAPAAAIEVLVRRTINNNGIVHPAPVISRQTNTVAATSIAINANSAIGDVSLTTASAWTGIVHGDTIYIGGNAGTPSNEEFARVSKIVTTTLTVDRPLKKAHTNADTVVNNADCFQPVWLAGGSVYEVICDYGNDNATGSSVRFEALATTYDSDSSV